MDPFLLVISFYSSSGYTRNLYKLNTVKSEAYIYVCFIDILERVRSDGKSLPCFSHIIMFLIFTFLMQRQVFTVAYL